MSKPNPEGIKTLEQFWDYMHETITEIGNGFSCPEDHWHNTIIVVSQKDDLGVGYVITNTNCESAEYKELIINAIVKCVQKIGTEPKFLGLVMQGEIWSGPTLLVQACDGKDTHYHMARILTYRDLPPQLGPWRHEQNLEEKKSQQYPIRILQKAFDQVRTNS